MTISRNTPLDSNRDGSIDAIRERQRNRDPDGPLARAELASTWVELGNLERRRGDATAAEDAWQQALALIEPVAAGSEVVAYLRPHALALLHLGRIEEAGPLVDKLLAKGFREP
ncbi:MAG: hypothetical protein V3T72_04995 [Thermoanaerobaculia bacterium]